MTKDPPTKKGKGRIFWTTLHTGFVTPRNITKDCDLCCDDVKPVPTGSAEQSWFRSDITRPCWVISVQSTRICCNALYGSVCVSVRVAPLRHLVTQHEEAKNKLCILCCLPSGTFFPIYCVIEAAEYNHPCISPFFMAPDANSSPPPIPLWPYSILTHDFTIPASPLFPTDFIFTIWNLSSNWNLFRP